MIVSEHFKSLQSFRNMSNSLIFTSYFIRVELLQILKGKGSFSIPCSQMTAFKGTIDIEIFLKIEKTKIAIVINIISSTGLYCSDYKRMLD